MSRISVWPWVRPFLIVILAISIPPIIYWFGYVQSSVSAAKQQAYASVGAVSAELASRLAAHDRIAANAERYAGDFSQLTIYLRSLLALKAPPTILSDSVSRPHLSVGGHLGGLELNIGSLKEATECKPAAYCVAQAVIPLESLISRSVVEEEFDGLVVLDQQKQLLTQDRRLPMPSLGAALPLQFRESPLDVSKLLMGLPPGNPDHEPGKEKTKSADGQGPGRSTFDSQDDVTVRIAGVDYVAFLQIVSVSVSSAGGQDGAERPGSSVFPAANLPPLRVLVCGLISKDRLWREAIQLSPQTLILVGTLGAFGLFAIPFLKLRFIGERERMRQRDVWLLAGSVLFATALMVLVLLDIHAMFELRSRFDTGVRSFARSVAAHLEQESRAAVAQLRVSAPLMLGDKLAGEVKDATQPPCDGSSTSEQQRAVGAILARRDLMDYPDFEAVIVTDLCGNQLRKWMPRTLPTPNINIANESYFSPTLGLSGSAAETGLNGISFGATLAPTSGLLLGVYATPIDARTRRFGVQVKPSERTGVIALATQLHSVAAPIVAHPFQFVLIDRSGAVTFQGMQGSFRGERFFETVQDGDSLERAAHMADDDAQARLYGTPPQTYQYRGKLYRMTALDISELQLTLITSYETEVIGDLAARIFTTSVLFSLGVVGALLLAAAILNVASHDAPFDWMWPGPSRIRFYSLGIAVCVVLALMLLLCVRSKLNSSSLAWTILVSPALVIVLLATGNVQPAVRSALKFMQRVEARVRGVSTGGEKREANSDPSTIRDCVAPPKSLRVLSVVYTTFGIAALLTFIAIPTALIFDDAFNLHGVAFTTEVSRSWRAEAAKRIAALSALLVDMGEPLGPPDCKRAPDLRCSSPEWLYVTSGNRARLLERRKQLSFYEACADLTHKHPNCSAAKPPAPPFSFTSSVALWLAPFNHDSAATDTALSAIVRGQRHAVPSNLLPEFDWSGWDALGVTLLLAAMWLLVRSVAKHVLGIELTSGSVLDEHGQVLDEDGTRWLLLRPSRTTMQMLGEPDVRLDLRSNRHLPAIPLPAAKATLLIEHIEARLCDKEWRDSIRLVLENATAGRVILTSELDPLHYLTETVREKSVYLRSIPTEEKEKRAQIETLCRDLRNELARWAVALRDVKKIRELPVRFRDPNPNGPHPRLRPKIAEECGGSDELEAIGLRLLERPDLDSYRWEAILGFVLDAAEPFYRAIWELCSREERLVLIQLAQAGLVNPKREDIVRRLGRRGLIIVEPRFRLMNSSFKRFVCAVEPHERVSDWERTDSALSWSRLGTPLYALAAMVIAVLLFAEQGMFTNILAVATGSAATLGSLRSLYASMTKVVGPSKLS